ncbi:hypothetical protein I317_05899 [Kwoniella heveanensis CBS 569]|nr:hypothetical protein I317_05899 [Kwoniella heveanensis CBS 569]
MLGPEASEVSTGRDTSLPPDDAAPYGTLPSNSTAAPPLSPFSSRMTVAGPTDGHTTSRTDVCGHSHSALAPTEGSRGSVQAADTNMLAHRGVASMDEHPLNSHELSGRLNQVHEDTSLGFPQRSTTPTAPSPAYSTGDRSRHNSSPGLTLHGGVTGEDDRFMPPLHDPSEFRLGYWANDQGADYGQLNLEERTSPTKYLPHDLAGDLRDLSSASGVDKPWEELTMFDSPSSSEFSPLFPSSRQLSISIGNGTGTGTGQQPHSRPTSIADQPFGEKPARRGSGFPWHAHSRPQRQPQNSQRMGSISSLVQPPLQSAQHTQSDGPSWGNPLLFDSPGIMADSPGPMDEAEPSQ